MGEEQDRGSLAARQLELPALVAEATRKDPCRRQSPVTAALEPRRNYRQPLRGLPTDSWSWGSLYDFEAGTLGLARYIPGYTYSQTPLTSDTRIAAFLVTLERLQLQPSANDSIRNRMSTTVTLETTMGAITVELYTEHAPKTCRNFVELTRRSYYDDCPVHRIIADFMIQTGDPTGTGRGGSSIYGEKFEDEIHPGLRHTGAGVLSMANAGPNTNGSQFFITLAPTPWLDGKHTIFGRVRSGLGVVRRMGMVRTGAEDRPVEEVKVVRARVSDDADDGLGE
ncbi:uncharacterized protein JN550_003204 [Neoarthrinium moseri]|uniref:uncharacterized protein n=1 Tax=Neoarthrinium moseri TaxID=1658444 RepID=UPI001FDC607D|nr:uncharacterized protein JN550_003204 [Neoarthrinium moseri]KAI1873935.1 hypothetical protein JN550_003204 [Neoarthrinium moseri]